MDSVKVEALDLQTTKDLKQMLTGTGPCLSVYMPLSSAPAQQALKTDALAWKQMQADLRDRLGEGGDGMQLLDSVADFGSFFDEQQRLAKAIVLFRSAELFRVGYLQESVPARAEIGPQFLVRPLLPHLEKGSAFYLLALSQNDVRLLRCTLTGSEEVPLTRASTSFDAYMDSAKPDHSSAHGAATGGSGHGGKMVTGTTNTQREGKNEYLHHFFKQVNDALVEVLREKSEPLVLVGVEYELAIYRTVNSYPQLLELGVHGAPNGLKSGEMHARALEAINQNYEAKVDGILAEYDHKAGGGASNRLKDVVTAAHDGRITTLVISDSSSAQGNFDVATNEAHGGGDSKTDLVNEAAVQTILHGGTVYVAPNAKMPHGAPAAAIFRY